MTSTRSYHELFAARQQWGHRVCVGLDLKPEKISPAVLKALGLRKAYSVKRKMVDFCEAIIQETGDIVAAFKINVAMWEAEGPKGMEALQTVVGLIKSIAPDVPIILDQKAGDIGNTNDVIARKIFDYYGGDAMTAHCWHGFLAMEPFLKRTEKGIFLVVRTSNPGGGEIQAITTENGDPLFKVVAGNVSNPEMWNANHNCSVIAGSGAETPIEDIKVIRQTIGPEMGIGVPGIGKQGGALEETVAVVKGDDGDNPFFIHSARAVIHASSESDFTEAARKEVERMNAAITAALN